MADRVIGTKTSIWVEFTALAAENKAVNLGQGFPDNPAPRIVTDFLKEVSEHPEKTEWHQYTRGFGHSNLVHNLAQLYTDTLLMDRPIDPMKEVLVTCGAYLALYYAMQGWLNANDEVLLIEPAYDCYAPQIRMAGAVPVPVPLRLLTSSSSRSSSADLHLDIVELERKVTDKTKMLILNNPHNPTGKLFSRVELEQIASVAERHDLMVVTDEVYEWLIYPGNEMIRFASLPGMYSRTITIGSVGKTFNVTGWKIGWAVAPERLLWPLKAVHQNCVFTCSTPIQEAIARALQLELSLMKTAPEKSFLKMIMSAELLPKRDKMVRMVEKAGFKPIVPQSGYFLIADFSKFDYPFRSDKSSEDPLDYRFACWLTKEKKLALIPCSAFYSAENRHMGENFVRFCFFKTDETLSSAEEVLKNCENAR